jgi:hypothetical protein
MSLTAIEGVVVNGRIRLRDDVALPENTRVYVLVAEQRPAESFRLRSPRLADPRQSAAFRKQIVEAPPDAAL